MFVMMMMVIVVVGHVERIGGILAHVEMLLQGQMIVI